jgi:hypothetical protein
MDGRIVTTYKKENLEKWKNPKNRYKVTEDDMYKTNNHAVCQCPRKSPVTFFPACYVLHRMLGLVDHMRRQQPMVVRPRTN